MTDKPTLPPWLGVGETAWTYRNEDNDVLTDKEGYLVCFPTKEAAEIDPPPPGSGFHLVSFTTSERGQW